MKKITSLFMLIFFTSAASFSLEKNITLSIVPYNTLQNGTLFEYVYEQLSYENEPSKLSELNWPLENIFYFGQKVNFKYKHLTIESDFSFGIPKESGCMEDYDWQDYYDRDMCTNYSITENSLNSAIDFKFLVGVAFNPVSTFIINPFIGYSLNTYDFYTANGWGRYGDKESLQKSWNDKSIDYNLPYDDPRVKPFLLSKNDAIEYKRYSHAFVLGTNLEYKLLNILDFGLSISTTPYIYTSSIDHHIGRTLYFLDIMKGIFTQWNFGTSVAYNITNSFSILTDFSFNYMITTYGVTYMHEGTKEEFFEHELINSISACGGNWWNFSVGVSWTF